MDAKNNKPPKAVKSSPSSKPKTYQLADLSKLPAALKFLMKEKRWVVWKWVPPSGGSGKWGKPPFQAANPNRNAETDNPETWATFEEAVKCVESGKADGIGFCLLGFNLGADDLDDCIDPSTGEIAAWAETQHIEECIGAYVETTVSGGGLRIIGLTEGKRMQRKFSLPGKQFELYRSCERYITISGLALLGGERPLRNIDAFLEEKEQEGDAEKEGGSTKRGRGRPPGRKNKPQLPKNLLALLHLPDKGHGQPVGDGLYPDRSAALFGFLRLAVPKFGADTLVEVLTDEKYKAGAIYQHCLAQADREKYILGQIDRASEDVESPDGRVIVRLVGEVTDTVREIQLALNKRPNCQVYRRGKKLVEPLHDVVTNSHTGVKELNAYLRQLDVTQLGHLLQKHAIEFQKSDGKGGYYTVDWTSAKIALITLLGLEHADLRRVNGVISSPTMRHDGSLLTANGYDEATKLWHKLSPDIVLPDIPEEPTREQAEAALALFDELLSEVLFKDARDRAVVFAAFLTIALRAAFPNAPIIMVTAPDPRSGKTYVCLLISALGLGWAPIPTAGSNNPEEMEKRIETALLGGPQILYLNNLHDGMTLKSVALEQNATEGKFKMRMLGKNDVELICDCRGCTTVLVNGNNITMEGALVERTVVSRIDTKLEHPGERKFNLNPLEMINANRGKYLAAAFTIVRAYIAAGSPASNATPFAGFEGWSKFVREPLIWLGVPDPVGTIENARALDQGRGELRTLITELRRLFKVNEPFDAATLIPLAEEKTTGLSGSGYDLPFRRPKLNAALRSKKTGKIDSATIGRWILMINRDKTIDGFRIEIAGKDPSSHTTFKLVWVGKGEPPPPPEEEF